MSTTALTILPSAPSYLAAFAADFEENSALGAGASSGFGSLSIKGKTWHLVKGGERTLVTHEDGDPRASLELVILKAPEGNAKTYYESGYSDGSDEKPICYSNDGITPSPKSESVQSPRCATCPHNAFGSKISETGAKGKACSDTQRLAVAARGDLTTPLLLRVPVTSLKDLKAYGQLLTKHRVPYSAAVTKTGFDHSVAYPKLTFSTASYLSEAEFAQVRETRELDIVNEILGLNDLATPGEAMVHLPPPPAYVQAAAPAAVAKKIGRPPAAEPVVTADIIDAALADMGVEENPKPAPVVQEVKPKPAVAAKSDDAAASASAKLDAALAALDFDD